MGNLDSVAESFILLLSHSPSLLLSLPFCCLPGTPPWVQFLRLTQTSQSLRGQGQAPPAITPADAHVHTPYHVALALVLGVTLGGAWEGRVVLRVELGWVTCKKSCSCVRDKSLLSV